MKSLSKNVWLLAAAQALMMSAGSMIVFIGGIIGANIAPHKEWATLPVASIIVGTAVSSIPVALSMKKHGRKKIFIVISVAAIVSSLISAFAIAKSMFFLLCIGFFLIGISISAVNQFRFAAMESVSNQLMPRAASTVLLGGIAAAIIGPEITTLGKDLMEVDYVGSFILLSGLFLLGGVLLSFYENIEISEESQNIKGRSLSEILQQPIFWVAVLSAVVGYGVMSFIMTATPVSMHNIDGHSEHHTKWVIQSHVVAMFLPSLITPWLIEKWGSFKIIISGVVIYSFCIVIAFLGHALFNYWASLILLGVGWNFLFLGGTTLLPQSYGSGEQFKVQATNDFMVFGMQAIASLSAGFVVFTFGWQTVILSMIPALLIPLGAIFYLKFQNKYE